MSAGCRRSRNERDQWPEVLASEDGDRLVGLRRVLQGKPHAGAHLAGGATADRVHHQQGCAWRGYRRVNFGSGPGFFNSYPRQLFTHGDRRHFRIHSQFPQGISATALVCCKASVNGTQWGRPGSTPRLIGLDGMEILANVPFAPYTTFKIGGPAHWFAEAASEADILEAVSFSRERGLPLLCWAAGAICWSPTRAFPDWCCTSPAWNMGALRRRHADFAGRGWRGLGPVVATPYRWIVPGLNAGGIPGTGGDSGTECRGYGQRFRNG